MKAYLLREIRERFREELVDSYSPEEISNIFQLLVSHYFGFPRTLLALEPQKTLQAGEARLLMDALDKLRENVPVQYITGKVLFMGMALQVSPAVLIPRPETEELVRWILESHASMPPGVVLDIGTGSGCIALGIKKNWEEASVTGMDLSSPALEMARSNARELRMHVTFRQGDIRDPGGDWAMFDLIVSNPPYVPDGDRASMQLHVVESEPEQALFVPDGNPLGIYRDILLFASGHLKPGGWVYLEIYEAFGDLVWDALRDAGFVNIELKKDIFGKDRFVRGQYQGNPSGKEAASTNQKE